MRRILVLTAIFMPDLASAHVGHLGDLAGHSHWIALGALGVAAAVGALTSAKGKRNGPEAEDQAASDGALEAKEVAP